MEPAPAPADPNAVAGTEGEWDEEDQYAPADDNQESEEQTGQGDAEGDADARRAGLQIQNSMAATTGLLRLREAGSGPVGTFRVNLVTSYFSSSKFLCAEVGDCPRADDQPMDTDDTSRAGAHLGLSVTPLPFLEAYMGMHSLATSNDQSIPELLQVLGDTNLGVKAFTPQQVDDIFSFGADIEIWLLNGTGNVGLNFSGTSYGITGLASADLNNRSNAEDRIPVRLHANLGYFVNNSGELVEKTEQARERRITRLERFGLEIDRVDSVKFGLGAEYIHESVRPFAEWTWDIPSNRQGYTCYPDIAFPRDGCLDVDGDFGAHPSRLTLGARVYPWFDGLSVLGALDIGTGATSRFIEELAPEPPWQLYFGISFSADPSAVRAPVEAPVVEPEVVEIPTRTLMGTVLNAETREPIADAQIRYQDVELTGMLSGPKGTFQSVDLAPGTYTLFIKADGYRDGECVVTVPDIAPPPGEPASAVVGPDGAATDASVPALGPDGMPVDSTEPQYGPDGLPVAAEEPAYGPDGLPSAETGEPGGDIVVPIECQLEALPPVGAVDGVLLDSATGVPVPNAQVTITDKLGRSLQLAASAAGEFRFANVPPGMVRLSVAKPGYLPSVIELEIQAQKEEDARIRLNQRPEVPNVTSGPRGLKLTKPILFEEGSAIIVQDSFAIVQETAQFLQENPDIESIEIQGHVEDDGNSEFAQSVSQERAEAVRRALVDLGVDATRLTAVGMGKDKPLVPNISDANRAKNRRIEFVTK